MFGLNYKLLKLEEEGNPVYAGVVGAGNQGKGNDQPDGRHAPA